MDEIEQAMERHAKTMAALKETMAKPAERGARRGLPEIMSAAQVAKWLLVSPSQVRRLAAEGRIPGVQVGSLWRFSREQLDAWIAAGETA